MCSCLCAHWSDKQLTHIVLHLLISVGERRKARHHIVVMTGGGFLSVRVCWLRWDFMWEQRLLALRRGFPAVALSGRRAVPRRILTSMLLLWLTWSGAHEVVFADYYAV